MIEPCLDLDIVGIMSTASVTSLSLMVVEANVDKRHSQETIAHSYILPQMCDCSLAVGLGEQSV